MLDAALYINWIHSHRLMHATVKVLCLIQTNGSLLKLIKCSRPFYFIHDVAVDGAAAATADSFAKANVLSLRMLLVLYFYLIVFTFPHIHFRA